MTAAAGRWLTEPRVGLSLVLLVAAFSGLVGLDVYPRVHSDEVLLADPALSFARHLDLASPLVEGSMPGSGHTYWDPPLYLVVLGAWIKLAGFGLVQVRLLSGLALLVASVLLYRIARRLAQPTPALLAAVLFASANWTVVQARIARMDLLCVTLGLAAVLCYLRGADGRRGWWPATGLLTGLAIVTHPLGAVVAVGLVADMVLRRQALSWRHGLGLAALSLPLLAWLLYAAQDPTAFWAQVGAQVGDRTSSAYQVWISFLFLNQAPHVLVVAPSLVASSIAIWRRWSISAPMLVSSVLIGVGLGRSPYYLVAYAPWMGIAIAQALDRLSSARFREIAVRALMGGIAVELAFTGYHLLAVQRHWYADSVASLRAAVPPGQPVYLKRDRAEFPAVAYFAFEGRNPVRERWPLARGDDAELVAASRFVVTAGSLLPGCRLVTIVDPPDPQITVYDVGCQAR